MAFQESYLIEYTSKEAWLSVKKRIEINEYADRHIIIETIPNKEHPWSSNTLNSEKSQIALTARMGYGPRIPGQTLSLKEGRRYFITFFNNSRLGQSTDSSDHGRHLHISTSLFVSGPETTAKGFSPIASQTTVSFILKEPGNLYYCLAERPFTGGVIHIRSSDSENNKEEYSDEDKEKEEDSDKDEQEKIRLTDKDIASKEDKGKDKVKNTSKVILEFSEESNSNDHNSTRSGQNSARSGQNSNNSRRRTKGRK